MKGIDFQKTTFTPAEAEAITGVNVVQQRNLRRHGYLPKTPKGMTRFKIDGSAGLLVTGKLAERGIPPSTSTGIAKSAGVLILLFAQDVSGAIADPENLAQGEKPIKYQTGMRKRFLIAYGKSKNEFIFENDLTAFYAGKGAADLTAAIVLDLQRLAETLCERPGRPLWKVVEVD
jgi:hypothetical protein